MALGFAFSRSAVDARNAPDLWWAHSRNGCVLPSISADLVSPGRDRIVFDTRGRGLMVVHPGDAVHLDVERPAQMCNIEDLLVKTCVQLLQRVHRSRRHHGGLGSCLKKRQKKAGAPYSFISIELMTFHNCTVPHTNEYPPVEHPPRSWSSARVIQARPFVVWANDRRQPAGWGFGSCVAVACSISRALRLAAASPESLHSTYGADGCEPAPSLLDRRAA